MSSYDEMLRQLREKNKGTKNGSATAESSAAKKNSYDTMLQQMREKNKSNGIDDTFISKFIGDSQKFIKDTQSRFDGLTWSTGRTNTWTDDSADYRNRSSRIRAYLRTTSNPYDEKTTADLNTYLDSLDRSMDDLGNRFYKASQYFSQWDTEEDYDFWEDHSTLENRQKWYKENQNRIAELRSEIDNMEYDWTDNSQRKAYTEKVKELEAEIARAEADIRRYERGGYNEKGQYYGSKTVDDYQNVTSRQNFDIDSAFRDYDNPTREELAMFDALSDSSTWYHDASGVYRDAYGNALVVDDDGNWVNSLADKYHIKDRLGLYLSASEDERIEANSKMDSTEGTWDTVLADGLDGNWEELTNDEIAIYYALLRNSQEAADKYLADMKTELNYRHTQAEMIRIKQAYDDAKLLEKISLNVASMPAQLVSGVTGSIENAYHTVRGEDINPYSAAYAGTHYSQTVRGTTAEKIDEAVPWAKIPVVDFSAGDLYQTGMSGLDSLAVSRFGKLGGVLLGAGAASSEAMRLYQEGASQEQIVTQSVLAGAAEMIFENIGIDNLLKIKDVDTVKGLIVNVLKQGSTEALEEGGTEIANILTDTIVRRSESDWAKLVEANGGDTWKAFLSEVQTVAQSTLGGFFSGTGTGGISAGTSYAGNQIQQNSAYRDAGRQLIEDGGVDPLTALAKEMYGVTEGKEQRQLGRQTTKVEKSATPLRVGKLQGTVQENMPAYQKARAEQTRAALVKNMTEKGVDTTQAETVADAIATAQAGEELSQEQMETLRSLPDADDRVLAAIEEVGDQLMQSAEQDNVNIEDDLYAPLQSAEGKVLYKDKPVEISGVDSAGDGKLVVTLEDGHTADVAELSFPDIGEKELYEAVAKYADSAESARQLLENYRTGNVSAQVYARGIAEAHQYGRMQYTAPQLLQEGVLVQDLNADQITYAYDLGKSSMRRDTARRQQEASQKGTPRTGSVNYGYKGEKVDKSRLNEAQKVVVDFAERLADKKGMTFYFYRSHVNADGRRVYKNAAGQEVTAGNGYYDPRDSSIHIDLNAGDEGSAMLSTIAHELVHFIQDWSPEKYRIFCRILMEGYTVHGNSVREMVLAKQAKYRQELGIELTSEQAYDEVIASSMESVLNDGNVMDLLDTIETKDKSLWEQIRSFLEEVAALIHRTIQAFRNVHPESPEGEIVERMTEIHAQLQLAFAEGLHEGGENYRTGGKENTAQEGGVKMQARRSLKNPNYLDPTTITKEDVREMLEKAKKGEYAENTYIPVRISTPGIVQERLFADNLPMAMPVKKARQEFKADLGPVKGKNVRGHELTVDELIYVIEQLDSPDYLFSQEDGRGIAVLSLPSSPVRKTVVVDFGQNINASYMNGYDGGKYNISITAFNIDGGDVGLFMKQLEKGWNKVFDKQKEGDPAKKFQATRPFAIEQDTLNKSILKYSDSVKGNSSIDNEEVSTQQGKFALSYPEYSPRHLLANVAENMVANSEEWRKIQGYRKMIQALNATEEHLTRINAELKKLMFAEGQKDYDAIQRLQEQKRKAIDKLNRFDARLINLENSDPIRQIVIRMREQAYRRGFQKAKTFYQEKMETKYQQQKEYYEQSRQKAVERHDRAQMRKRIRKEVESLRRLNERAPKDQRTKEELQAFAKSALKAADAVFLENYNEYEMIRNGVGADLTSEEEQLLQECRDLLEQLGEVTPVEDKWDLEDNLRFVKENEAIKQQLFKKIKPLRDAGVFRREFNRLNKVDAAQLIDELTASYAQLKTTESDYLSGAYQEEVYNQLQKIRERIGAKSIKDMSMQELQQLYEMYHMVLHVIRTANETFAGERGKTVTALGNGVVRELEGRKKQLTSRKIIEDLKKTGWNGLTVAYAFRTIGSDTMLQLYKNLRNGEDVWARDMQEAKDFWQKQVDRFKANDWDMDKRQKFYDSRGNEFSVSLGQLMSLYALSKRRQAWDHLEVGGFMLDNSEHYITNIVDRALPKVSTTAQTYRLTRKELDAVCSKLTPQQRAFVDATQNYLSADLADKGNEVSMKLYGIKLFKDKDYFPLRTASQGRYQSAELIDQNKLKNSGFTKELKPKASNSVVLSSYSSVWTGHVNQMGLYHGLTLPMEDMDRVLNFGKTIQKDENGNDTEVFEQDSVCTTMQNIFGQHPENYIRELMKQLNGGVRSDDTEQLSTRMLGRFKKAAVAASLSVWIQQWTSMFRAMAYIDPRFFAQGPQLGKQRQAQVEDMKAHCPVAIIKEMGGFDTGMGASVHDFITGRQPHNIKEWGQELLKHPVKQMDEISGWLPQRADENTWVRIWIAAKRETLDKHKDLRPGSDEFYKLASDRFNEVITLTQVYDSVMAKSAMMRSKNFGAKMLTQFMAEPTIASNMAWDAGVQMIRTGKPQLKTAGALVASVIVNAMCSSLIYAMRDDDEEETFLEKYAQSLISNLADGLNPLTYIPIVRDIWSIAQGYDVGRSDMELWSSLSSSLQKLTKKYADEDATPKEIRDAWWSLADNVFSLFGIPEKNVRREINAGVNVFQTLRDDFSGRATTGGSMGDTAQDAFLSSVPILGWVKGENKAEKLLDASIAGDSKYVARLRGTYKTENAANNAVAGVIRDRFEEGKLTKAQAIKQLTTYAGKNRDEAEDKLIFWQFQMDHPDSELTENSVLQYEELKSTGISLEVFTRYKELCEGKSKRAEILPIIDSLPLTVRQKDALYFAKGYAESTLHEAPWH